MTDLLTYEQPLNEVIRVGLRLEQLFQQVDHYRTDTTPLGTRTLVVLLMNILHLLDRPDLKAKLAKELSQHLSNIMRLEHTPEIDKEKWHQTTSQLDTLIRSFIESSGKIGQRLRDIELLNTLRLHLASPGGGCSFDIPLYHYWLHLPIEQRQATLNDWFGEFAQIRSATELLLKLVREGSKTHPKTAVHGFYQELLDPQMNLRMIRVSVSDKVQAFPEISIGRHFLSIRFFVIDINKRPVQYTQNVDFMLAYCNS